MKTLISRPQKLNVARNQRNFSQSKSFSANLTKKWASLQHWYYNQVQEEKQVVFDTIEESEKKRQKRRDCHQAVVKLANESPVYNKILGNALGDAVGLATEFLTAKNSQILYGEISDQSPIPFPNYFLNRHNQHWKRGDWSDDTDQLILILQTILEAGSTDPILFAKKLDLWVLEGFPELGDEFGAGKTFFSLRLGLGALVNAVVQHEQFLKNPSEAARSIYEQYGKVHAPNGALMRTAILGCWEFWDLNKVEKNTREICHVTHAASCLAVTIPIALMIQGKKCEQNEEVDEIVKTARTYCDIAMWKEDQTRKEAFESYFVQDSKIETLKKLELDEPKSIGYTLKCMGSGLWGLYSSRSFESTISMIAKCGGDADTNAAVAGAMWGARNGYTKLPETWLVEMPDRKFLDDKATQFLTKLSEMKSF